MSEVIYSSQSARVKFKDDNFTHSKDIVVPPGSQGHLELFGDLCGLWYFELYKRFDINAAMDSCFKECINTLKGKAVYQNLCCIDTGTVHSYEREKNRVWVGNTTGIIEPTNLYETDEKWNKANIVSTYIGQRLQDEQYILTPGTYYLRGMNCFNPGIKSAKADIGIVYTELKCNLFHPLSVGCCESAC